MGKARKNSICGQGETLPGLEWKTAQEIGHRQALAAGFLQLGQAQRAFAAGDDDAVATDGQDAAGFTRLPRSAPSPRP